MSEIKLFFVRHGEAASAWQNHENPGLSKAGLLQAKNLIKHNNFLDLKDFTFMSSPKSRAIETAQPLANKFNKEIVIEDAFIEIPSHDIPLDKKKTWLEEIIKMDKDELPKNIKSWRENIFIKLKDIKNDSIIFTHFMVLNSLISELTSSKSIFCFYPDYTSIVEINMESGVIKSFSKENDKKTYINL
jgi:broad specificity phosphatase PhoE|tara:strand:+ start:385 stop:948 length:564 start_codon:yes stop_codon:yes gene_type:complete